MVVLFAVFLLVWSSVAACCGTAEATLLQAWHGPTGSSNRLGGGICDSIELQLVQTSSLCENAAALEGLAKITGNFDDFHGKGALRSLKALRKTRGILMLGAKKELQELKALGKLWGGSSNWDASYPPLSHYPTK